MAPARPGSGTTQEAVRRHNLGTLLAHLHHDGQLSRASLTERMGLNRSTIGGLVGELVDLGVVQQTAPARGRAGAGRPSLDVRPSCEDVYVLAAEIGVDTLRVARVGLGGRVLNRAGSNLATDLPGRVAADLVSLLREAVAAVPPGAAVLGIGVGVPGVVREDDGVVRFAPNLGWRDVPLAALLRERMASPLPLRVANDADLGALAEHTRGAVTQQGDVVFLAGEVGIGGGVIVGGRPLRGVGGYAGELGHLMVNPRGRACRCGSIGCWETEVGGAAISRALGIPPPGDLERLATRLAAVRTPNAALRRVGRYLGLGLASIVNVLNPEVVVLGGVLRLLYPAVREVTDETLTTAALLAPREQVRVVVPALGGDAVLVGAAETCFQAVLADPARELAGACRDAVGALGGGREQRVQPRASVPA
ncbi:MAG TPA: ROK family protein [Actinomycetales bacterium]|nr:ROK family protein [Actinomycetales bacterium]